MFDIDSLKISLKISTEIVNLVVEKRSWCRNKKIEPLLFIFDLQVRSPDIKEEEKEEGEHVDDDVDSLNGEDV